MLIVSGLTRQFRGAETPILKDITFTVNAGERAGLIGPNGSGKSTLLGQIVGDDTSDSGSIQFNPPDLRIGYLAQGAADSETALVRDVLFPNADAIDTAQHEVDRLAALLAEAANGALEPLMQTYGEALDRLAALGYAVDEAAGERALAQVGLAGIDLDRPVMALSGGQKTRLVLARLLVDDPQFLVLDEPTNHLDVTALEWLEAWLADFPGGVLVVSHDRAFLDRTVNHIIALDPETATARTLAGTYSDFADTIRRERDKQWSQWRDQEDRIGRMKHDASRTMARAVRKENATNDDHQRRLAKKVAARAKSKETRLQRYLDSDERVEKPGQTWQVKMRFGDVPEIRQEALRLDDLSIGYDPAGPLLTHLDLSVGRDDRIAIMGPNGHGKSTLLKTLIGHLPPLAGQVRLAASAHVGYLAQEQEILDPAATALTTIQREARLTETEARSFLHFFLFAGDDPLRPIAQLSYGERSRLMLARLVARGANLLVLDEPLNHLDLPSRERFEEALANFPGAVLAVAHDRYFVDGFATHIWHVADGELETEICTVIE
jgi:ATP-binding cassette subfamily F protein 3